MQPADITPFSHLLPDLPECSLGFTMMYLPIQCISSLALNTICVNAHRDTAASHAALLTFKNIKKYSWLWMCGHTFRGHSCCRICRWSVTTEHRQVHLQGWDSCSSYTCVIATHRRVLMTRLMEKENIKVNWAFIFALAVPFLVCGTLHSSYKESRTEEVSD